MAGAKMVDIIMKGGPVSAFDVKWIVKVASDKEAGESDRSSK